MKSTDAIKEVMKRTEFGTVALAEALGLDKRKSNVLSQRFTQENISVKKLNEMLAVMGYKLVVMPSNKPTPQDGIKID